MIDVVHASRQDRREQLRVRERVLQSRLHLLRYHNNNDIRNRYR